VEQFGPEAQEWIAEFRAQFPYVTSHHLAQVTRKRFVKLSSLSGAVAGVAGGVGAVFDFGVLAWNQARMVIYLATIYGEDPTSRDRAAELLMLQNVHKVMGTAQTALDVAARRAGPTELLKHSQTMQGSGGSLLTLATTLAKMVGMKLAK
jgi:phage shock protein PspC (stress-responsive transcriptional regulator)